MWAISNVHPGRIWPAGCRFLTPGLNLADTNCILLQRHKAKLYLRIFSCCLLVEHNLFVELDTCEILQHNPESLLGYL